MKRPHPLWLWVYRGALVMYPVRLRLLYRDEMLQTLRDAYNERQTGALRFWLHAYSDLVQSSVTERLYMLRNLALQSPLASYTLVLAVVITLLGGSVVFFIDQMMRNDAGNQPQIDMAEWYAGEISAGEDPGNVIPPGYVDMERSLQPFVIFYDDQGKPGSGTGYLDQELQAPPVGVFGYVRERGIEKVTWQPRPGVRIASVIKRVNGNHPGFVLAGRSLRLVEHEKDILWLMAMGVWIVVMVLLFGGASLLQRAQQMKSSAA